jgi:hypothetical protein
MLNAMLTPGCKVIATGDILDLPAFLSRIDLPLGLLPNAI